MKPDEAISGLIVDPCPDSRMRLKQATAAVPLFHSIHLMTSLKEAVSRLSGEEPCDVVFISEKFQTSEITSFIMEAKKSAQGQMAAFILVLGTRHQDSPTVASNLMKGIDGFLFEPYSVNYLAEITQLTAKIRNEHLAARERLAIKLLVTDIIKQLDVLAYLQASGCEPGRSKKDLRDLCSPLAMFSPESQQIYMEAMVEAFIEAPLPTRLSKINKYHGASERVKKQLEDKLAAELQSEKNDRKGPGFSQIRMITKRG